MNFLINLFKQSSIGSILFFLVLSAGPTVLWLIFCLWLDKKQPEPKYQIFKTFFAGGIITLPLLIIAGFLTVLIKNVLVAGLFNILIISFLIDGVVEEFAKYIVLRVAIVRFQYLDELKDGMIYGMVLGLGFAFVENVLYGLSVGVTTGTSLVLIRGFSTTLLHFLTGGIIGFFIVKTLVSSRKYKYFNYFGFLIAVLIHGSYNLVTRLGFTWQIIFPVLALFLTYLYIFSNFKLAHPLNAKE